MIAVKVPSLGRAGGLVRRYPGGTEKASILRTVLRWMPKRRAASRWLSPSTWQAWRTLPYSSTENIPRLPARSDRAQGRHQGGTVWHRRGRDTQPAVSEGHFLTAAYTRRRTRRSVGQFCKPEIPKLVWRIIAHQQLVLIYGGWGC